MVANLKRTELEVIVNASTVVVAAIRNQVKSQTEKRR